MQLSRLNKLSCTALLFASSSTSCGEPSGHPHQVNSSSYPSPTPHTANTTSSPSIPDIIMSSLFADIASVITHDLSLTLPTPKPSHHPRSLDTDRPPITEDSPPLTDDSPELSISIIPTPIQSSATVILVTSPTTISVTTTTQDPSLPSCILDPEERNSPACLASLGAMQHSATLTMSGTLTTIAGTTDVEGPLPTCTGVELYCCIFVPPSSSLVSSTGVLSTSSVVRSTASVVKSTPSGSAVVVSLQSAGYREGFSLVVLCGLVLLGCVGVW